MLPSSKHLNRIGIQNYDPILKRTPQTKYPLPFDIKVMVKTGTRERFERAARAGCGT